MTDFVQKGALAPQAIRLAVTSHDLDLTTASAATIRMKLPDGTFKTLAATLSGATTTTDPSGVTTSKLSITHAWLAGDVDLVGHYSAVGYITMPTGAPVPTDAFGFAVSDPFA